MTLVHATLTFHHFQSISGVEFVYIDRLDPTGLVPVRARHAPVSPLTRCREQFATTRLASASAASSTTAAETAKVKSCQRRSRSFLQLCLVVGLFLCSTQHSCMSVLPLVFPGHLFPPTLRTYFYILEANQVE